MDPTSRLSALRGNIITFFKYKILFFKLSFSCYVGFRYRNLGRYWFIPLPFWWVGVWKENKNGGPKWKERENVGGTMSRKQSGYGHSLLFVWVCSLEVSHCHFTQCFFTFLTLSFSPLFSHMVFIIQRYVD